MDQTPILECVTERDVDLLLLEELHVTPAFATWFARQVIASESHQFVGAWHSLSAPNLGESDLVLIYRDATGSRLGILLENKITAPPQPEQGRRYRLRGQVGIAQGRWTSFVTCIVAPAAYVQSTADAAEYDIKLNYEIIREWFLAATVERPRAAYRAKLLSEAIEQNRRGYRLKPDVAITHFWQKYWELIQAEFPCLKMNQPQASGKQSDWPQFRNPELGVGRRIVHKWTEGLVDLEIGGAADRVNEIREQSATALHPDMVVTKTTKSASVRIRVPPVDKTADFSEQLPQIRAGLIAAVRLLEASSGITG